MQWLDYIFSFFFPLASDDIYVEVGKKSRLFCVFFCILLVLVWLLWSIELFIFGLLNDALGGSILIAFFVYRQLTFCRVYDG